MSLPTAWLYVPAPWWLLVLGGLATVAAALPWRRRTADNQRPSIDAGKLAAMGFQRIVVIEPPRHGEW